MKLGQVMEGLQILQKYYDDPEGYHIGAEHDEIYAYATDQPLSEDDIATMWRLGWTQPDLEDEEDAYEDIEDGEEAVDNPDTSGYDRTCSWRAYV